MFHCHLLKGPYFQGPLLLLKTPCLSEAARGPPLAVQNTLGRHGTQSTGKCRRHRFQRGRSPAPARQATGASDREKDIRSDIRAAGVGRSRFSRSRKMPPFKRSRGRRGMQQISSIAKNTFIQTFARRGTQQISRSRKCLRSNVRTAGVGTLHIFPILKNASIQTFARQA